MRRGEVHCLLGENGAGKTTLAECLYGTYRPDSGTIRFKGQELSLASPRQAIDAGIGMVHQHFALAPALTVLENVMVGTSSGFWLDRRAAAGRLQEAADRYGAPLDLDTPVGQLSVGEQQWVEIVKALYVGVDLLILDEPTAVLSPLEATRLFDTLGRMTDQGMAVLLITHKLDEVVQVSDRVTILAKGEVIATVDTASVTKADLARMMVGREVALRVERTSLDPGEVVLEVDDVAAAGDRGRSALRGVSFAVRRHEILGVVGVSGNGQRELFDVLVGVRRPHHGRMRLHGADVTGRSVQFLIEQRLSSVPEDRMTEGLVMDFRVSENLVLGRQREPTYARWGVQRRPAIDAFAKDAITSFAITTPSPRQFTRVLSGGNMQKIILARELAGDPACLVVSQPTRGLDVGAAEYVRRRLLDERARGSAIVLISEDLDEVLDLADRIVVMFEGRIVGELDPATTTSEEIGLLMGGVS